MDRLKKGIKQIGFYDVISPLLFLMTLLPGMTIKLLNRMQKKQLWLVTERRDTASDNAYWFYRYLKEKHPEINSWYVIDKKCREYKNVEPFGNIIQFRSIKHWIYYLASDKKISSQKASNPAPALFYILHIYFNWFNNRIYLKHGIIKDNASWWHFDNTKYSKIICGAKKEYEYIRESFGYPEESVVYTGLARFDNLHGNKVKKNQILVMPSWRNWLGGDRNVFAEKVDFKRTAYYKAWDGLLNNQELVELLDENDLMIMFYPHHNMWGFIDDFNIKNGRIQIARNVNIQELLKESALLVTDFSSVFMDFAYMRKPMVFYQFDREDYRKRQYRQGYFDYEKDGFGGVSINEQGVIDKIKYYIERDFEAEKKYTKRMKDFFPLYDTHNCKRIYEAIK